MTQSIAILDDEADIVQLVSIHLTKAGFQVRGYTKVDELYKGLESSPPNLLILDLMLPGFDGFEICKNLRGDPRYKNLPIIMLTAKDHEVDKVLGLELGADDYVTKPFSPKELAARVKAVLRRRSDAGDEGGIREICEGLVIDTQKFETLLDGVKVELTSTEFKILDLLSRKKGWVYTRQQILNHLWGDDKMVIDRTIDVHIRHLREKLGGAGDCIKNVRGVGYKIE